VAAGCHDDLKKKIFVKSFSQSKQKEGEELGSLSCMLVRFYFLPRKTWIMDGIFTFSGGSTRHFGSPLMAFSLYLGETIQGGGVKVTTFAPKIH
jgi:hypothetical protein